MGILGQSVNETRMTSLAAAASTKESGRLSGIPRISFQEAAQLGRRARGRQPCQGLNADPGAGAQRALGTKKGRGESRKFSFSYHPQRRASSHYVKMQKDDRRIAEEADLPAFLQPSMRRKKTALNDRAARERLRRCILSKA